MVHCLGDLSGRNLINLVPWRKRWSVTWSKLTSTTICGNNGFHSADRSVDHRLGAPGAFPVKPGSPMSFSSFFVRDGLSDLAMLDVNPTWLRRPFLSYRPRSREPTSFEPVP